MAFCNSLEQLVSIELFGQLFTVKAQADAGTAREVADILVREVGRILSQEAATGPNISKVVTLILAALNIAGENIELRRENAELQRMISERTMVMSRNLDSYLTEFRI
jgi:cell division protein ZapA (FtsZ GTPase activity inhibitor)